MTFQHIGKPYIRPDAVGKATGKAVYLDDVRLSGMLHAAILHPEHAHARILRLETEEAENCDGVVKVVTGRGCEIRYGENIRDLQPMAVDKVRHIGEAVAAVVADTPAHAKAALARIRVEYERLPVYLDARDAMQANAILIHEKIADYWRLPTLTCRAQTNVANVYQLVKGRGEDGFDEADVIVEREFNFPLGSCAAIEPHGAIVWFREDGRIEAWSSSICPFIIREELAHSYGRAVSDVRVHIPELGGCFGYKSDVTVEQTIAWIASFVPGRPVKWVATREEDFTSTLLAHGIRTVMKLGAKRDGRLVAIKSIIYHSAGGYADTAVNVTMAATHNSSGPYEFPHCDMTGYTVYTNTPPVGAYRGYGHPESQLATERMMDLLARQLGMDPFELRMKNFLREGKVNALGEAIWKHTGDMPGCAERAREIIFGEPKPAEDDRFLYGRAVVGVMKSPKGASFSTKGCYMKMNIDGSVTVTMSGAEVGQGLRTVIRQVAAEALKLPIERVSPHFEIDTDYSPYEWQTIGSMFTLQGGRAIIRAADRLIDLLKKNAALVLRTDVDYLEYDGEYVFLRNDPSVRVSLQDLARGCITGDGITVGELAQVVSDARLPRYSNPNSSGQGSMGVTYTFGAQGVELRIEKDSGKIFLDHFASVFDVGQVINSLQIRGCVLGGVTMAIGGAMYEQLLFDEHGRITNPHLFNYHIPTYKEVPRQTIEFLETPDPIGPFGARGIGEHCVIGGAPAILNAVYDAIGVDFCEVPITPAKIKAALESRTR
jgi:CO/xanthine dehydrogenase Mo-binding subunit